MGGKEPSQQPENLEQLLDRIEEAAQNSAQPSLGAILEAIGRKSFGALLLLAGLITLAPLVGDIPGVPTLMGLFVLLIGVQLLFRKEHFWLPHWLLNRSVAQDKLCKATRWLRRPARFLDRLLRPRLTIFTNGMARYLIAIICILIAVVMPAMELVPFSANGAGAALTAFGLAVIARDGLLALFAFGFTAATAGLVIYHLV